MADAEDIKWQQENSHSPEPGWAAPTCLTCKWWTRGYGRITTDSNGRCHRRAPVPGFSTFVQTEDNYGKEGRQWSGYVDTIWPLTEANDWCGDHERGPVGG